MKYVAVLGSTGSIGRNTLEVIESLSYRLRVIGLSAHNNWRLALQQADVYNPKWVVFTGEEAKGQQDKLLSGKAEILFGREGIEKMVQEDSVDLVMVAMVGAAGLHASWVSLEAGKDIALANKETLVVGGSLVMDLARSKSAQVIPVDSEHSAIFQAMMSGKRNEVRRIILTASGGPFRTWTAAKIAEVTPEQALKHPTWKMGSKITIDSATMMNKAMEIIEARWLFDMPAKEIEVLVHPQSVVHSMVEFEDGSVIAQLSPPDMKLPIQYALTYPDRTAGPAASVDWNEFKELHFEKPDFNKFPALKLGYEVAEKGGTAGAVLNAANEVAVDRFLSGGIKFGDIPRLCTEVLDSHDYEAAPAIDELWRQDEWARTEAEKWKDN